MHRRELAQVDLLRSAVDTHPNDVRKRRVHFRVLMVKQPELTQNIPSSTLHYLRKVYILINYTFRRRRRQLKDGDESSLLRVLSKQTINDAFATATAATTFLENQSTCRYTLQHLTSRDQPINHRNQRTARTLQHKYEQYRGECASVALHVCRIASFASSSHRKRSSLHSAHAKQISINLKRPESRRNARESSSTSRRRTMDDEAHSARSSALITRFCDSTIAIGCVSSFCCLRAALGTELGRTIKFLYSVLCCPCCVCSACSAAWPLVLIYTFCCIVPFAAAALLV